MKRVFAVFPVLLLVGCSVTKGGYEITAPNDTPNVTPPSYHALQALTLSPWTGTTTATGLGDSGTLTANFTFGDGGSVQSDLTWTSGVSSLSYHGTVTGTVGGSLAIVALDAPSNKCEYHAQGTLSQDGLTFSGTYYATGPGVCPQKTGVFTLSRQPERIIPNCPAEFVYNGPNPFELPNSGEATELAYVQANVHSSLVSAGKTSLEGTSSWTADGDYAVVLVKAATKSYIYVNVHSGDVLLSQSFNQNEVRQNISHVSRFVCAQSID